MSKSRNSLAIFALLLGIGGIAFGGFNLFFTQNSAEKLYYVSYAPTIDSEAGTKIALELNITFSTKPRDLVIFTFVSTCRIYSPSALSFLVLYFVIDGIREDTESFGMCQLPDTGSSTIAYYQVSMRYIVDDFVAGIHNVTIELDGNYFGNLIRRSTLMVQVR